MAVQLRHYENYALGRQPYRLADLPHVRNLLHCYGRVCVPIYP
jgi:hypothetical protein